MHRRLQKRSTLNELLAEIRALQTAQGHPNVLELRGLFEDAHAVHLVMDLCTGGDLFEYMAEKRHLHEAEATPIFRCATCTKYAASIALRAAAGFKYVQSDLIFR